MLNERFFGLMVQRTFPLKDCTDQLGVYLFMGEKLSRYKIVCVEWL